jgi:hypothetical protein
VSANKTTFNPEVGDATSVSDARYSCHSNSDGAVGFLEWQLPRCAIGSNQPEGEVRVAAFDPQEPAADFSASDRSTFELDLPSRSRKSRPRRQPSFVEGQAPIRTSSRLGDCSRRQRTHAADPSETYAAMNSPLRSGQSRMRRGHGTCQSSDCKPATAGKNWPALSINPPR